MQSSGPTDAIAADAFSLSNPSEHRVRHIALDLTAGFDTRVLSGSATLTFDPPAGPDGGRLVLDTRDLTIEAVETAGVDGAFAAAPFQLAEPVQYVGSALTVTLPAGADRVRVRYRTSPQAAGVQWLDPAQTADGTLPFVYTQAEPTYARSYLPAQDTPSVRVTYDAVLRVPAGVAAVMAAENQSRPEEAGVFGFSMPQPIPSYLIALAAGDLAFQGTGSRTGDWAERSVVAKAAWEFADAERMVETAESLFGPYRWGRWDLLVLPPSFPYGGMENPRLTFLTPTIIAGDRSLADVITHELAHSWSGNLVTNATWSDFWLNEGFTVYAERRITELLYGAELAEMEWQLGRQDLQGDLDDNADLPGVTRLKMDLAGLDPEQGLTTIPYEKGALFLLLLAQTFGRERFDPFLRAWFDGNAFTSRTTEQFLTYLATNLLAQDPDQAARIDVQEWLYAPGLPANAPVVRSAAFARVDAVAGQWLAGTLPTAQLPVSTWVTFETLHFLRGLPDDLTAARMADLDAAFHFTEGGNSEILFQWLLMSIRAGYHAADARLREFLLSVGRRKFVRPLYVELVKTPEGEATATAIYRDARPRYHPIVQASIDAIVGESATA